MSNSSPSSRGPCAVCDDQMPSASPLTPFPDSSNIFGAGVDFQSDFGIQKEDLARCGQCGAFEIHVRVRILDTNCFLHPDGTPIPGPMVPQTPYAPTTDGIRHRYVEGVQLAAPISFMLTDPEALGLPARDALDGNSAYLRLRGRDAMVEIESTLSAQITLRIQVRVSYAPFARSPNEHFSGMGTPPGRSRSACRRTRTLDGRFRWAAWPNPWQRRWSASSRSVALFLKHSTPD